jgi:hypothetical protein
MKWFLVFCLLFLANCAGQATAQKNKIPPNQNNVAAEPTVNSTVLDLTKSQDNEKLAELARNNEKFKIVPEQFKNVDFKNFTFLNSTGENSTGKKCNSSHRKKPTT